MYCIEYNIKCLKHKTGNINLKKISLKHVDLKTKYDCTANESTSANLLKIVRLKNYTFNFNRLKYFNFM